VRSSAFSELTELQSIIIDGAASLGVRVVCEVKAGEQSFPVYVVTLGNPDPAVPAVGFFGGFHGLERIGSEVVLVYLRSLLVRLRWDNVLHKELESVRLVFMPLVNPAGMWQGTRANFNGVDLMRNAPVESREGVPFMIGGQRLSARLPWYRGALGAPMEAESQAVCRVVEEELLARRFSLAVDCHSGFGLHDRIWFPYAHTALPIEHLSEIHALKDVFDKTYTAVQWPVGLGGKGNEGVSAFVQRIPGAIGYVEYAYAKQNKMAHALMQNAAGNFVGPDDLTFKAAAAGADWTKSNFGEILTNMAGKDSWPITGATFILMQKLQDKPAQATEVLKFFDWAYKNGGKMADELDYVPLPDSLVKLIYTSWNNIKDTAGKPVWAGK